MTRCTIRSMNIKQLSDRLGTAPNTIRNWTSVYSEFLTPSANPTLGKRRELTAHDLRVLNFVATLKNTGTDTKQIVDRLQTMQHDDWAELPALPPEWVGSDETVTVALAASRASEMAQVAVLQTELQHALQSRDEKQRQLEAAQIRYDALSNELASLQSRFDMSEDEKTNLRIELERAKGEVQALQAQIAGFTLAYGMGRGKPINVAVIIVAALLIGAVLVIVAMVIGALVG